MFYSQHLTNLKKYLQVVVIRFTHTRTFRVRVTGRAIKKMLIVFLTYLVCKQFNESHRIIWRMKNEERKFLSFELWTEPQLMSIYNKVNGNNNSQYVASVQRLINVLL